MTWKRSLFLVFVIALLMAALIPAALSAQRLCLGKAPTIRGAEGGNTLSGTPGGDIIHGLGGKDTIYGGGTGLHSWWAWP
jgi:RTX calcium-binding nonapeptide repeat (4 copies)